MLFNKLPDHLVGGFVAIAWGVIGLSGCAQIPKGAPTELSPAIKNTLEESRGALRSGDADMTVPADVAKALLPPMNYQAAASAQMARGEQRFDVVADNASAREVFVGLAEGSPYSMVVHPEVTGKLSVDLKSVTLLEALEVLRTVHGYSYQRDGNRIMILGQGMRTQIFPVNYLSMSRKGMSSTSVSSSQLTGVSSGSSSAGNTGAPSAGSTAGGAINVQTTTDATFWTELKSTLDTLIGTEDGRKVMINPQSSLAIVRALPHELDLVHDYLGLAHENANRQVVLEAKVLEVELSDGFQSGVNWAKLRDTSQTRYLMGQSGGASLLGGKASDPYNEATDLLSAAGEFIPSAFGGLFTFSVANDDFGAFLELLKTQGQVQTLSSPRVSTVNNQKAVIKVGGDEFFITGVSNTNSTSSTTETQTQVEMQAFFSGVALDVTPQIDEHDNILLHIHPTVSEVAQSSKTFVLNDKNYSLPLAASKVQESDNVVRAQSGQIIVIGGLMKEATSETEASIPILGDMPLIGGLFKHKKISHVKKELVILLKPTVMVSDEQWRKTAQESRDRVFKMVGDKR